MCAWGSDLLCGVRKGVSWTPMVSELTLMPDKPCPASGDSSGKITSHAVSPAVNLIKVEAAQQLNISKP